MIETITRWAPAAFFTFVACFYTIRILLLQRDGQARTSMRDPKEGVCAAHVAFRVLRVLVLAASIAFALYPPSAILFGRFDFMFIAPVMITGDILLFAAFAWVCAAHMSLGESWRSGITAGAAPPLVTHGLYRWSRNPTYLGVIAGQVGFFLALPSAFSLGCLIVGVLAISARVRKEERYLAKMHGEAYRRYSETAPRWAPFPVLHGPPRQAH